MSQKDTEEVQNMNYQEIVSRINDFLAEDFEVEPSSITPQATLKETLDLDSLDYIDLIVAIESNFGFKVKPEDFQTMVTIKDFYDYVANRLQTNITA
jgi:acyl carrier protein